MKLTDWIKGATVAAACLLGAGGMAAAQEMKTVRIATSTTGMLYVPIYVAESMGYFDEEGIDLELQTMKSSAIMAAVIGGDVDIYPGTPAAALRAVSAGTDIRIFGTLVTQYASNVVLSGSKAEELGIDENSSFEERVAALEGLTIGVTGAGSGTHQLALYLLREAGLNPDSDATIVFVGGSREILAAFERDRIDAFILSNPTSDTAVMDQGGFLLFDMAGGAVEELQNYPYITLDARGTWLEEDPERSKAIVRALAKALAAIKDPEQADEVRETVYQDYLSQFDKELFEAAWSNVTQAYPATPALTEEMLGMAIEYLNAVSEDKYDKSLAETALMTQFTDEALASQ
ncbi:NitT/TauT family transport system substrate-binding protein [Palleronia aestuarii]|uniref:NitT/TauT family transport system substrate-binding protein n=1 Tax=Palleronia aestuarii TaxID=568105 RepID=A0A2W7NEC9_9RHOB|nr:ABC transporter substrate-binding protein [Palleronia aestuarii]PZX15094.1 NitT/TauT family transport system substrate-binding protein [Palleronia aestuarii]